eukprot:CAMPEP_0202089686 /NCGR_PEP_ID=MMETSP0964-20121228/41774_1 /ASSEMBLY_ACC=CAM_ASM_000500 /TAXON_ID=4773 /ORGANISM="Schizochytrium aggregatum, Strain ATCC28209" /LENGTH=54 /DNA_ID=CAMNT_0048657787 /DNA_START=91 /DNA_END=252 /DNA_ORIENTATION=-
MLDDVCANAMSSLQGQARQSEESRSHRQCQAVTRAGPATSAQLGPAAKQLGPAA